MLNKPRGFVTTLSDEKGRKNAAQLVADCGVRVYPVGRLDKDSEGMLLLTNDGDLYGCGDNQYGQQGNGTTSNVTTFTKGIFDLSIDINYCKKVPSKLNVEVEIKGKEGSRNQINKLYTRTISKSELIENQKWDEIIDLCKQSVEIVKEARKNG